jgi:hypothetical protein
LAANLEEDESKMPIKETAGPNSIATFTHVFILRTVFDHYVVTAVASEPTQPQKVEVSSLLLARKLLPYLKSTHGTGISNTNTNAKRELSLYSATMYAPSKDLK